MKSIKEKAIEVFPRHCNAYTDYSNFEKIIGFNSGANYVLDAIAEVINQPMNDYLVLGELEKVILQLKK